MKILVPVLLKYFKMTKKLKRQKCAEFICKAELCIDSLYKI